jgi:glycosyltransferase involved in cell wall biosynthesis
VKILTNVPSEHLPSLYASAIVTVYPSYFEGFGLPIVESLMMKTPVITSKGSCFPEVAGPGAIYIDPSVVGEIAEAMKTILDNSGEREKLAQLGHAYVDRYRSRKTTEVLLKIYKESLTFL